MRTEAEIRTRIEKIKRTNAEDGWILGLELRENNKRIIRALEWALEGKEVK